MDNSFPLKYFSKKQWEALKKEADKYPTPNIVTDLGIIEQCYKDIQTAFPYAKIYAAVKTYPQDQIMNHLKNLGSNFLITSVYELDRILKLGVNPNRISYGNTIKKAKDIKYAYEKGIRLFVTDSMEDVKNLSKYAPGSEVFFRLYIIPKVEAVWPLTFKFGIDQFLIKDLIIESKKLGLIPKGISFHVGSQQENISAWENPIQICADIFKEMKEKYSIEMNYLNLGGGLPANYVEEIPSIKEYGTKIMEYLNKSFPNGLPQTIVLEPGRGLFGNSSITTTSVILISQKQKENEDRWLFVDTGIYNGFMDTFYEGIHYPLYAESTGEVTTKFIIAGPTCDSVDIIYKNYRNPLPKNIKIGDKIYFLHSGAYARTCSVINFNGFSPIDEHIINSNEI